MKIHVDLENCYGIKKLEADFDFSRTRAFAVYAPNGAMKSSLAQTFQDIIDNKDSKDRIFVGRKSKRLIRDGKTNLAGENILVIRPYDEVFGHTEKTSTLLVNAKLRKEYEQLHEIIKNTKEKLLIALKAQSKSKRNIEQEVSSTFTKRNDNFALAISRISHEMANQTKAPFATVPYDLVFDEKVLNLLNSKGVKESLQEYIKRYSELLAKSVYFKHGTFNYYNAGAIAKSLADHGFSRQNIP